MIKSLIFSLIIIYFVFLAAIYFFQEKLLFITEKTPKGFNYQYKEPFEERFFQTEKGLHIHGLHFIKEKTLGVILYFHGNAYSLESWGGIAEDFKDYPYDFLIVDYRGYGKSDGQLKSEVDFFNDAQKIYNELKKQYHEKDIIIYGRSMGSGSASFLAGHNSPKMVILETPFFSLETLIQEKVPLAPKFLIKYPLKNYQYLKKSSSPIYMVHGTKDELIPFEHSFKLKNHIDKNCELIKIENGGHNNLSSFNSYHERMRAILSPSL